jgi:hypothetical protein
MLAEMQRLIDQAPRDKYAVELREFLSSKSGVGKLKLIKVFGEVDRDTATFEKKLKELGLIN